MTKVTLINPPFGGQFKGTPLGLLYVATALKNQGYEVSLVDLDVQLLTKSEFQRRIKKEHPNYVGITSMSPSHLDACRIAGWTKEITDVPIIKGGSHDNFCYETTLRRHPEIDYSIIGPGEETLCNLVESLEKGSNVEQIPNLAYRKGADILANPQKSQNCLDNYPHPDRTILEQEYNFPIFGSKRTTQIRMSRGCSHGCTFCPIDRNLRFHSADYVLKELHQIVEQGYQAVFWDDAIFTVNKLLVSEVLTRAMDLSLIMGAQTRADVNFSPEMAKLMRKAGFTYLSFGLESGDPEILSKYKKHLTIIDVERAVNLAKSEGLTTAVTAIIGGPDENLNSIHKTLEVIQRIKPDFVSWSVYSIYPGSLLPFNPQWYESLELSREDFWKNFDEGYKAKHVKDIDYIYKAWKLIQENTGKVMI
ncbi:MAG: radical SAM protein [Candidatus Woesearchaeota archaeon]